MRKLFITSSMMIIPLFSAGLLPKATWQVYSNGILTVYNGSNVSSGIFFQGTPSDYKGDAAAPVNNYWTPGMALQAPTPAPVIPLLPT